jgi:hypothetical protein
MQVRMLLEEPKDQRSVSAANVNDRLHVLPRNMSECCEPGLRAGLHRAIERSAELGMPVQPAPPIGSGSTLEHILGGSRRWESFGEGAVHLAVDDREVAPARLGVTA